MGEQVAARYLKKKKDGGVAQLGEHLPCKQGVKSSNLSVSIRTEMSVYCTLKTSYRKRIDYRNDCNRIKSDNQDIRE